MRTLRRLVTLFVTAALVMAMTGSALAQGPKHTSCQGFGHLFADFAQNPEAFGLRNAGEGISHNARHETEPFGDGTIFTPPGSIAEIVHYEQIELGFCQSP